MSARSREPDFGDIELKMVELDMPFMLLTAKK